MGITFGCRTKLSPSHRKRVNPFVLDNANIFVNVNVNKINVNVIDDFIKMVQYYQNDHWSLCKKFACVDTFLLLLLDTGTQMMQKIQIKDRFSNSVKASNLIGSLYYCLGHLCSRLSCKQTVSTVKIPDSISFFSKQNTQNIYNEQR